MLTTTTIGYVPLTTQSTAGDFTPFLSPLTSPWVYPQVHPLRPATTILYPTTMDGGISKQPAKEDPRSSYDPERNGRKACEELCLKIIAMLNSRAELFDKEDELRGRPKLRGVALRRAADTVKEYRP